MAPEAQASRWRWWQRIEYRFTHWLWFPLSRVALWIHLHADQEQRTQGQRYSRMMEGISEATWTYVCGSGFRASLRALWIFWRPRWWREKP